ncbi:MAG: hypothetical protein Q9168_003105 [Polycauliona sp. 1 TL-2023]
MEPVGISIGAVGLISLLSTCVECFEYIDAAKTCGRDLELLTTKFAIEKARLLIWGESVGLCFMNPTAANKVESTHVRPIVEQILNCIHMLLEDTNALTARYGLKPTYGDVSSSSLAVTASPESAQSVGLPLRLKASYLQFVSRITQNHKNTSTTKKTRWAVRDRNKFMNLVEDIRQLINGLEAITDSVDMAAKRATLVNEELRTIEDPEDLRLIAEASAGSNKQWSDAASVALEASVCAVSCYGRIRDWVSAIPDPRTDTFVDYARSVTAESNEPGLCTAESAQLDHLLSQLPKPEDSAPELVATGIGVRSELSTPDPSEISASNRYLLAENTSKAMAHELTLRQFPHGLSARPISSRKYSVGSDSVFPHESASVR